MAALNGRYKALLPFLQVNRQSAVRLVIGTVSDSLSG
jgi:hypothetical protein